MAYLISRHYPLFILPKFGILYPASVTLEELDTLIEQNWKKV